MFSWKLFEQSWAILRRVKMLWVLAIAYEICLQLGLLLPSKNQEVILSCGLNLFSLPFNLLPFVILAGMIIVVDRDLAALPISIKEVWQKVRPLLGRIIFVPVLFLITSIIFLAVLLVILFVFYFFFTYLATRNLLSKDIIWSALLLSLSFALVLAEPTLEYGLRAVCIEQKPALKGFFHGTKLYRRSFLQAFGISFLSFVLYTFIQLIIFGISSLISGKDTTVNLLNLPFYQQLMTVFSTIAFQVTSIGFSLIAVPYTSVLYTLLYKQVLENEKKEKFEEETYSMLQTRKPRRYLRRMVSLGLRKTDDSA